MKKHINRILTAVMAFVMTAVLVTGCSLSSQSEQSKTLLFSYDGSDVYLDEAWVYAKIAQTGYESQYLSTFGDTMWSMQISTDDDGNPITMEDMVKENVIEQIKQVKVLNNKAEELKVSLTDDEKKTAADNAKTFADQEEGKAIFEETGANQDLMQKIYEENALASKVQQEVVKDVDTEVSDDEARQTTVYKLVFETTETDSETGAVTDLSDSKKAAQKKKAEAALKEIKDGKTIEEVAEEYELTDSANETYGAGESAGGDDFEKEMASMKDGDISDVLTTNEGYVIAKLVAYTDEEATATQKETIVSERQSEAYQEKYEEWTKDLDEEWDYAEDVDQDVWAEVTFGEETEAEESSTGVTAEESDTSVEAESEEVTTESEETDATANEESTTTAEEADTAE
ncbi:MAG: peptidyl-prolyl cis-trans isomerase [Lachnospiraceae bacterium]|nr:peptidyl-prolyl cis-trans isomerase [Lachnospiraceae bacterium]